MPSILFYIFAILMLAVGICVVSLKNPVSSAMGMIGAFVGIAALLIGINAYFVGTLQVLVYAGAIMVLFIFIIMLLDLKKEENKKTSYSIIAAGIFVPLIFVLIMIPVLGDVENDFKKLDLKAAEASLPDTIAKYDKDAGTEDSQIRTSLKAGSLPDVNLIGQSLFTEYNFPLQVVGVLLLVSTVGCVALSKKLHGDVAPDEDTRMAKTLAKSTDIPQVVKSSVNAESTETAPNDN